MFNVYILKSSKTSKSYVGFTDKDVQTRLLEHNNGLCRWTKGHRPLKLIYYETYYCKQDALYREDFLKSGVGNRVVKALIKEFDN